MKERGSNIHNQGGHVAVHGVEREVCNEDGWNAGCLGCEATISGKAYLQHPAIARKGAKRTTPGMLSPRERNQLR